MSVEEVQIPVRPPWQQALLDLWRRPAIRIALAVLVLLSIAGAITFSVVYSRYERIVDDRIRRPIFNEPAQIFAAADRVSAGDERSISGIVAELRLAGYVSGSDGTAANVGIYSQHGPTIQIKPGQESYQPGQEATLRITNGQIDSITGSKGETLPFYDLEPQLVTGLFDAKSRSKRRLLTYGEIPAVLRDAIVSVEDRRFFEHRGINYVRLVEGLLTPLLRHRRMQGGSTLTMQMARSFFLSNERSASRKLAEMMIALILERRFTKEQILAIYVNQVDLGQRGSFNIRGFGEASLAYFGKDIKTVTLAEAALLAGMVNGPSYFSPFRHPDRAVKRRNIVLRAMFETHVIDRASLTTSEAAPLKLAPMSRQGEEAPYYVDLVRDRLLSQYDESQLDNGALRVYTALDRQLQKAAADAVDVGMQQADAAIMRGRTRKIRQGKGKNAVVTTQITPGPMPQVALIALDPHTGEVLALIGGRDYAASQLDHALAKRPTGSIFKPFVYGAAMNTALTGDPAKAFTQVTMLDATEGTFDDNGKPWTPHNFDPAESTGEVTARFALQHSINTATVRLALTIGLDKVADLAKAAGIQDVKPTPSMAIGTYSAAPLDMAAAYTVFANGGVRLPAAFIRSIRMGAAEEDKSSIEGDAAGNKLTVLDPRVASVMTDMLQAVLNGGTASGVRARFDSPAAGKTGSSHDAWFAGYTSNLLCVIWVGNDDYSNIKIEGGKLAAPIWTEFMLRARKLARYHDMQPLTPAQGVLTVHLDKTSNLPADDTCPDDYDVAFIDGTVPAATCGHPEGPSRNFLEKMFGIGKHPETVLPPITQPVPSVTGTPGQPATDTTSTAAIPSTDTDVKPKKKGFWHRLFGGGGKKNQDSGDTAGPSNNQ